MPVTVVFGGQYGSEGKGKVAHLLAKYTGAAAAVRVGGPNSGHTPSHPSKAPSPPLRQLPTASLLPGVQSVIGPGSYVDGDLLKAEIIRTGLTPARLAIDPAAVLLSDSDRGEERSAHLRETIGSTLTGTGAAVARRAMRDPNLSFVSNDPELTPFVRPTSSLLRSLLVSGERVIVEGTQGHGLSVFTREYPFATSRITTASGLLAEAGLSPVDVDDVVMVLRAFPIRVAGNSGPLRNETTWSQVQLGGGHDHEIIEYSSVTKRVRRVAHFDPHPVKDAIAVNAPTTIALNHLDYLDHSVCKFGTPSRRLWDWVSEIESVLGRTIDLLGWGPDVLERHPDSRSAYGTARYSA